jgi:hypothetical protein
MSELTDYYEDLINDHMFAGPTGGFTPPATVYLKISTTAINEDGTGSTEPPTANGYTPQAITWNVSSGGVQTNNGNLDFGPNTNTDWGTIGWCFLSDNSARATGNALAYTALDTARAMTVGDTLRFATTTGLTLTMT